MTVRDICGYAGYTDALMEQEIKIRGDQVIWIDSEELRTMEEEERQVREEAERLHGMRLL